MFKHTFVDFAFESFWDFLLEYILLVEQTILFPRISLHMNGLYICIKLILIVKPKKPNCFRGIKWKTKTLDNRRFPATCCGESPIVKGNVCLPFAR